MIIQIKSSKSGVNLAKIKKYEGENTKRRSIEGKVLK